MIFKNFSTFYCKDDYCEQYDTKSVCYVFKDQYNRFYYRGYLIHREDGPAVEGNHGFKEWWLNGIKYSEKEYYKVINLKKKSDVLNEI